MSYEKQNWQNGDIITAEKLNNIENGIFENSILKLYVYFDEATESTGLYYDEEHTQLLIPVDINGNLYDSIEDARAAYNRIHDIFKYTPKILLETIGGGGEFGSKTCSLVKSVSCEQSDKYLYYSLNSGDFPLIDYADKVTVTFDMQGHGEQIEAQTIVVGSSANVPQEPIAQNYTFIDWYTESECINVFDFSSPVNEDITLYARWVDAADTCITFSSDRSFTLKTSNNNKGWNGALSYSVDLLNWNNWTGSTINSVNNKLYIRGINNSIIAGDSDKRWVLTGSNISCSGNIENLLDYKKVGNNIHPEMLSSCYGNMFWNCTSLTTPPELPATTLTVSCYSNMFADCTSLTTAPELPATTLTVSCYSNMFADCTSLTTAPELPATTLADYCYSNMFQNCTPLTTAPQLPATTLAENCYGGMFGGCTSLTTVPELPATTLANGCYAGMFRGCTSLTTPPELPVTTLADYCYSNMFSYCTSIKLSATQDTDYTTPYRIPKEGTGTGASYALRGMFDYTGGTFTGTPTINTTYYLYKESNE